MVWLSLTHHTDAAQPLFVVTNFGIAALPALLVLALYTVTDYVFWQRSARDAGAVPALGLAALTVSPLLFSSDIFAYAGYGWQALHGIDPYRSALLDGGAFAAALQYQWPAGLPHCVYGPLFVAVAAALDGLFHVAGLRIELYVFRAAEAGALLLTIAACKRAGYDARYLTHPAALWACAEGHNDALMLCALFWSIALQRSRVLSASLAWCACAIKGIAAVALLARVQTLGTAAVAATGLLIAALPLMFAAGASPGAHAYYPQISPAALGFFAAPLAPETVRYVLSAAVAIATALLLAARAWRIRECAPKSAWIYGALAAWALLPNAQPWYALWILAVTVLAPGSRAARFVGLVAVTALLRYIPDAFGVPSAIISLALAAIAMLPLLAAALGTGADADSETAGASRRLSVRP